MNIHLPAILMFTRCQGFDTLPYQKIPYEHPIFHWLFDLPVGRWTSPPPRSVSWSLKRSCRWSTPTWRWRWTTRRVFSWWNGEFMVVKVWVHGAKMTRYDEIMVSQWGNHWDWMTVFWRIWRGWDLMLSIRWSSWWSILCRFFEQVNLVEISLQYVQSWFSGDLIWYITNLLRTAHFQRHPCRSCWKEQTMMFDIWWLC